MIIAPLSNLQRESLLVSPDKHIENLEVSHV